MSLYYTGTQDAINSALAQINTNLGLPFRNTQTWAIPQASYIDPTFWFFIMPFVEGWTREDGTYFTQLQMITGISNVIPMEPQSDWFPPVPPPA